MQPTDSRSYLPTYLEICTKNPWALSRKETGALLIPALGIPGMIQVYRSNREIRAAAAAARSLPPPTPTSQQQQPSQELQVVPLSPPAPTDSLLVARVNPILVKKADRYVMAIFNLLASFFLLATFSCLKVFHKI